MSDSRESSCDVPSENQDSNSNTSLSNVESISNDSSASKGYNTFANDGSFLEMFKKKMQKAKGDQQSGGTSDGEGNSAGPNAVPEEQGKSSLPNLVGKRRRSKILQTGLVKKQKVETEQKEDPPKDAWSRYMAEVKKYREQSCEEEGKTRPLVK